MSRIIYSFVMILLCTITTLLEYKNMKKPKDARDENANSPVLFIIWISVTTIWVLYFIGNIIDFVNK